MKLEVRRRRWFVQWHWLAAQALKGETRTPPEDRKPPEPPVFATPFQATTAIELTQPPELKCCC